MSSWTEALVEDIGDLPSQMARNLEELREDDKATRNLSTELTKREADFLQEVKAVIKEHGSTFDESPFQQRGAELMRQRQELSSRLDDQLSRAKRAYEVLDKRIITFDEKTKDVKSLYAYLGTEVDGDARNKKKKRKSRGAEETEVQMNEPTYCFCRAVQYGEMIACDHPDCELEWFHYACVNIKVQPTDKWYCPSCRKLMGLDPADEEGEVMQTDAEAEAEADAEVEAEVEAEEAEAEAEAKVVKVSEVEAEAKVAEDGHGDEET